jgi:hypothetical protein
MSADIGWKINMLSAHRSRRHVLIHLLVPDISESANEVPRLGLGLCLERSLDFYLLC